MKRKWLSLVMVLGLALAAVGCSQRADAPEAQVEKAAYAPMEDIEVETIVERETAIGDSSAPGSGAGDFASVERLIIRNASLGLVVRDTTAALDEINDLVNELEGFIVESNVYQYDEGQRASVRLRIPAESLDLALERIRSLATEVRSESVFGQDVTEEYVDLKSSLRSKEATEAKLLEFLEEAEDTEATLAVYEQLKWVQAEIEQVKGRIQYLEQSAAMATITLDITPDELARPIEVAGWRPEGTLRDAFESLIDVLQFLADAAIVFVVLILPILIVIAVPFAVLFFIVRAIVRRRRARRASNADVD